jgi:hypothetical protein
MGHPRDLTRNDNKGVSTTFWYSVMKNMHKSSSIGLGNRLEAGRQRNQDLFLLRLNILSFAATGVHLRV